MLPWRYILGSVGKLDIADPCIPTALSPDAVVPDDSEAIPPADNDPDTPVLLELEQPINDDMLDVIPGPEVEKCDGSVEFCEVKPADEVEGGTAGRKETKSVRKFFRYVHHLIYTRSCRLETADHVLHPSSFLSGAIWCVLELIFITHLDLDADPFLGVVVSDASSILLVCFGTIPAGIIIMNS